MSTKSILIGSLLAIIVLAGVLAYGVEQIKDENLLASSLQQESDAITRANGLAQATRSAREHSKANLEALEALSLTQTELVSFIELVESTGRAMGLTVSINSVSADTKAPPPQPVHMSIKTDGSWSASLGFVHALENLPEKVDVDSSEMSLNANPNGSSTTWHTDSSITVYVFNN